MFPTMGRPLGPGGSGLAFFQTTARLKSSKITTMATIANPKDDREVMLVIIS
jgi:hypothetical protein